MSPNGHGYDAYIYIYTYIYIYIYRYTFFILEPKWLRIRAYIHIYMTFEIFTHSTVSNRAFETICEAMR